MEMLQYTATLSRQVSKQSKRSASATRNPTLLEHWNSPVLPGFRLFWDGKLVSMCRACFQPRTDVEHSHVPEELTHASL